MIKKYIEYINELKEETYLSAAKIARDNRQYKRSQKLYEMIYRQFGYFDIRYGSGQNIYKCTISKIELDSDRNPKIENDDTIIPILVEFAVVDPNKTTYINIHVKYEYNPKNVGRPISYIHVDNRFINRQSGLNFVKVLKGPILDLIRNTVHEADKDADIVDKATDAINKVKAYEFWGD